jgi:hypothetical protein
MNTKPNPIFLTSMALIMVCLFTASKVQALDAETKEPVNEATRPPYVLPQGLTETYQAYVDQVMRLADALPSDVAVRMHRLVGMRGIPFDHKDIEGARYVSASTPQAKVLFPPTYGGSKMAGITHGKLIVMLPEAIHPSDCKGYAVWAHELTHVAQNRLDGPNYFLGKYLSDAAKYDYPNIPYETAAYKVQHTVVARHCDVMEGASDQGAGAWR